jgi:hypothetical protein
VIAWDEALVVELAARRCIIFFGAGASAGSVSQATGTSPPSWPVLLGDLRSRINAGHVNLGIIDELIGERRYLEAAEVIVASMTHATYVATMRNILETPRFQPSPIHRAILSIDPKIVVTTKFDTIYDHYCQTGRAANGYNIIKYHDDHIVSELRTPTRCVIKAHGCITHADKMVLTKANYFHARQVAPHFYKVLDALFLTHTILFVGYGMSDPDIQLTLENATIAAPSGHKHYFVSSSGTNHALKAAAENAYNIQFVEFPAGQYDILNDSMEQLSELVLAYRAENADA